MNTNTTTDTTTDTFRVLVACFDATGTRRFHGGTLTVQATSKAEAAEVALAEVTRRDVETAARFNKHADRVGVSPRSPFPVWKVERVRRMAFGNR